MIELDEDMRNCLIEAHANYPDLDYSETVIQAFGTYVNFHGPPTFLENEEEGAEYFNKCVRFLIDCVLFDLLSKGLIELEGMEDGDLVFKTTVTF